MTDNPNAIIHAQPVKIEIGTTAGGKPLVLVRKYGQELSEVQEVVEAYLHALKLLGGGE